MVGVGAGQVLHVVIECLLQIAGGRVICGVVRRRLHRIIRSLERRICRIRILMTGASAACAVTGPPVASVATAATAPIDASHRFRVD